jgi:riboflavin kinase/FMN adenylyltransferase
MTVALLDPAITGATRRHWRGVAEIPAGLGPVVVTLGVFDGLHRGHLRLLDRAVRLGRRRALPVVLVTFDPHPASVTGPPRDTTPVTTLDRRVELALAHGADAVLVLPFDEGMARTPAEAFALDVLVRALRITDVVVGKDFRFGHRGAGGLELLQRLGSRHGFTAHGVTLRPGCSSTRIRELVAAGDLATAASILGRPHRVRGHLGHGRVDPAHSLLPPPGRYHVQIGDVETLATIAECGIKIGQGIHPAAGPIDIDFLRPA